MKPLWNSICRTRLVSVWRQYLWGGPCHLFSLLTMIFSLRLGCSEYHTLHCILSLLSGLSSSRLEVWIFSSCFKMSKAAIGWSWRFGRDRLSWRILLHLLFVVNVTRVIYHIYLKLYNFFIRPKKWMPFTISFAFPFVLMHENCTSNIK